MGHSVSKGGENKKSNLKRAGQIVVKLTKANMLSRMRKIDWSWDPNNNKGRKITPAEIHLKIQKLEEKINPKINALSLAGLELGDAELICRTRSPKASYNHKKKSWNKPPFSGSAYITLSSFLCHPNSANICEVDLRRTDLGDFERSLLADALRNRDQTRFILKRKLIMLQILMRQNIYGNELLIHLLQFLGPGMCNIYFNESSDTGTESAIKLRCITEKHLPQRPIPGKMLWSSAPDLLLQS